MTQRTKRVATVPQHGARTINMLIAELVADDAFYPRHAVDDANVGRLVRALEAGATLPPLIADEASKRIVDGWHRARAYTRVYGPTATADVELRHYPGEAEMILDAIELNAGHGRQLDRIDQIRCVRMADKMGITPARVAAALHQREEVVEKLRVRLAGVTPGMPGEIPGTGQAPVKRALIHLTGHRLTDQQATAMASAPGTSYRLLARQLTDAVRYKLANREDGALMGDLRALCDALLAYFEDAA